MDSTARGNAVGSGKRRPTRRPSKMSELTLAEERKAFDTQLEELRRTHPGQFVLMKNGQVIEFYPSHEAAYEAGLSRFGLDSVFLIAQAEKQGPQPVSIAWEAGVMFG